MNKAPVMADVALLATAPAMHPAKPTTSIVANQ